MMLPSRSGNCARSLRRLDGEASTCGNTRTSLAMSSPGTQRQTGSSFFRSTNIRLDRLTPMQRLFTPIAMAYVPAGIRSRSRMVNRLGRSCRGYNAGHSRIAIGDALSARGIPNVALIRPLLVDAWRQNCEETGHRIYQMILSRQLSAVQHRTPAEIRHSWRIRRCL